MDRLLLLFLLVLVVHTQTHVRVAARLLAKLHAGPCHFSRVGCPPGSGAAVRHEDCPHVVHVHCGIAGKALGRGSLLRCVALVGTYVYIRASLSKHPGASWCKLEWRPRLKCAKSLGGRLTGATDPFLVLFGFLCLMGVVLGFFPFLPVWELLIPLFYLIKLSIGVLFIGELKSLFDIIY